MSKITVRKLIDDLKLKEIISQDNKAEETYITERVKQAGYSAGRIF